jgi:5-methyltetrahydropteroyltriglutamate--homocysteine methyltransferase
MNRRIQWRGSINVEPFKFLKAATKQTPKVTIPAPTQVHLFAGRDGISKSVYPDIEALWDNVVAAYPAELRALGEAGCVYVQIDETSMPKRADPEIQRAVAARGQDWLWNA